MKDMEAKTTKMIAAVAVIVMCAAGLVGAGYAYTASTVNDGNSVTAEYVTLTQSGTGQYKFADGLTVFYDSKDYKDTNILTEYRVNNATNIVVNGDDYSVVKLGNSFTVEAAKSVVPTAALTVGVKVTGANIADGFKLILRATSADGTVAPVYLIYNGSAWSPASFSMGVNTGAEPDAYYTTNIDVFYGYPAASVPTIIGHASTPSTQPLNSAALTFTATVTGDNTNAFAVSSPTGVAAESPLSAVNFTVLKADGTGATKGTHYNITWKTAAGVSTEASTPMVAGTSYIAVITGAGDCASYQVYEYKITVPGA